MIDYVYGGEFLNVTSSQGSQPYINTSQPMTGMLRFYSGKLEVYDGSSWQHVGGGSAHVQLDGRAVSVMKWAEQKMHEEAEMAELAKKHPGVADLVEKVKHAEEQLRAFAALAKQDNNVTESS